MERYVNKRGKIKIWSITFKLHVMRTLLEQDLTQREAALRFKVNIRTVRTWVKQYRSELTSQTIGIMQQPSPVVPPDTLCAEQVRLLESALKQAELNLTALNALIDLAETTYKIPVRKNSGTKQ